MEGGQVGKDQAVAFAALIGDLASVEIDRDLSGFGIDFVSPMLALRDRQHRRHRQDLNQRCNRIQVSRGARLCRWYT